MGLCPRNVYKSTIREYQATAREVDPSWEYIGQAYIRTALGKRQPKQRMWALSGPAPLRIKLIVGGKEQTSLLEFLYTLPES